MKSLLLDAERAGRRRVAQRRATRPRGGANSRAWIAAARLSAAVAIEQPLPPAGTATLARCRPTKRGQHPWLVLRPRGWMQQSQEVSLVPRNCDCNPLNAEGWP